MAYSAFARYYDLFTNDVDYPGRAGYYNEIIKRYKDKCELVLDLACGTGSLSVELAALGYEVIGVDASPEMLSVAAAKSAGKRPVLYLCQDMARLDLYGTVDVAVCALDSVNHITSPAKLGRAFERVGLFIQPGGLFLFDVNTPHKHREILGGSAFVYERPGVLCAWRNALRPDGVTVDVSLDFFSQQPGGLWSRERERFSERAYGREELAEALERGSFDLLAVWEDGTFEEPPPDAQRHLYLARKRKA